MRGFDQGLGITAAPQIGPEPEGTVFGFQAQVGVTFLGCLSPGVEEALSLFLPFSLEGQKGFAGEVFALQLLEELSPAEDHLAGVVSEFFRRGDQDLSLLYGPVCPAGVETKESAERAVFPLELFPILPFQKAVVGVTCGAGEPAHQVQNGLFVFLLEEDELGVNTLEYLGRFAPGHSRVYYTSF